MDEDKRMEIKQNTKIEENINEKEAKNKIKDKIKKVLLIIIFNIIFPYLIFLVSNFNNENFFVIREIRLRALFINFAYLYEIMIIYGFYYLFKSIFKKSLRANIAISILFNLISIISFYKVEIVQKPFFPEDIFLIGNALEIMQYANLRIEPIVIIQIFINIIILVIQYLITKYTAYEKIQRKCTRVIVGIISAIILFVCCAFNWSKMPLFEENNLDFELDHYNYGAVINFFKKSYMVFNKNELEIYSEEKLEEIEAETVMLDNKKENEGNSPNIIAIMAESFTDITKMEELEFSEDPLKSYRKLEENYTSGKTAVNIYGGETATSEFEFLTGSNMKFIEGKRYPYSQVIDGDTLSIVRILKKAGYNTTAIHPNYKRFYNRNIIYSYLGFDNTVFIEDMKEIENYYAKNASDMDFVEEIIKQYESMGENKKFIFGITMESHMPYSSDKYLNNEIDITSKNLSEEEIQEIETYSQGLKNFDYALEYLTNYFNQKEEEVMIVVFGDHLPAFNSLYDEAYGESLPKYQTPYLIWTNYEDKIEVEENISVSGLSMRVLENANVELPWYYEYISEFYREYPILTKRFIIDKEGNLLDTNIKNDLIDNYNIIQFDILYRKNIPIW